MESSNMLDVLHFFFEQDSRYHTSEEAKAVEALRVALYETMYKTKYIYRTNSNSNLSSTQGFSSDNFETKSYIPPTDFDPEASNPFGAALEAPLR
jgi:hypothetical protein